MNKRSDGRWQEQVFIGYDENHKKKYKYFYGKTKAELKEKLINFEKKKNILLNKPEILFIDYSEKWLLNREKTVSFNTIRSNKIILKHCHSIYEKKLCDITTDDLQNIINNIFDKPRTCQQFKQTLNQIFDCAIKEKMIIDNPTDNLIIPKYNKKVKRALTNDENYITENCDTYSDREKMFLYLIKYCGLRKAEALALKKTDFNFNENYILINKSIYFDNNQSHIKLPKSERSVRKVPILNNCNIFFKEYLYKIEDNNFIFTNSTKTITSTSFKRMWEKIIRESNKFADKHNLNYVDFTPHIFRHNYATILFNSNVPVKSAQEILGHANFSTTMDIYTHLDEQNREDAKNKIDTFISKNIN